MRGSVKWFHEKKGIGFIVPEDGGGDVFCHYSAIQMSGYKKLEDGQNVEYDLEQTDKGPRAKNVRVL